MEGGSDEDENMNVDKQQNQPEKFYDDDDETSSQNEWEDICSETFRSLSDQRNKGRGKKKYSFRNTGGLADKRRCKAKGRRLSNRLQADVENEPDFNNMNFNKSMKTNEYFPKACNSKNTEFLSYCVNANTKAFQSEASVENGNKFCKESGSVKMVDSNNSLLDRLNDYKRNRAECEKFVQSVKPSDLIMVYQREINEISNECIENNLRNIAKIKAMNNDKAYIPIFAMFEENFKLQQIEFHSFITKAKNEINSLCHKNVDELINKADHIKLQIKNECSVFQNILPAYGYKSHILNALKEDQIIIVSSDCSYSFNLITPYIIQSSLPDHVIISYESNNLARNYVEYKLDGIIKGNSPKINYVTDDQLLKILTNSTEDLLLKNEFCTKSFVVILNLPLKRSMNIDLSLAFLRDLLLKQKDSVLIILTSIFDCTKRYQKYFSKLKTDVLKVPKLLLPVKTVWKKEPSKTFKEDVVTTCLSIHVMNPEGNVLAFLPNEDEAKICVEMFQKEIKHLGIIASVKCVLLEENTPLSYFSSRSNPNERIFFFATHLAEAIPIRSVRYVVDGGLKREHIFDKQKKIDILKTEFCSKAKARLRKSLACVFSGGICYRIFNKDNFLINMPSFEPSDILTLDPFDFLIKIFQYAPESALSVEFIEPLNDAIKENTVTELINVNAVKNGKLTSLGEKIAKLPLPTKYSKLIYECISCDIVYEAIVIAAYFSNDPVLFKNSEDGETQNVIDAAKLKWVQHGSDALTFLNVYRVWIQNNCSKSWCDQFHVNWNSLKDIQKKVSELCQYVDFDAQNKQQEFNKNEDLPSDLIIRALLRNFSDNLCVFSGHCRIGYIILSSSETGFIHPSSVLYNKDNPPQFLIFDKIICSDQYFLVNNTTLPPELVHGYDKCLNYNLCDIFEKVLKRETIRQVDERIIKEVLIGNESDKLSEVEDSVKNALKTGFIVIDPDVEEGCVHIYALESYLSCAVQMVEKILKNSVNDVINAEHVHTLELKKGEVTVPLEIKYIMGAKILSAEIKNNSDDSIQKGGCIGQNISKQTNPPVEYCLELTWVRRPCTGICFITFNQDDFKVARKFAAKYISVIDHKIYVEISKHAENQLMCTHVPREARVTDMEDAFKKIIPSIKDADIKLMFTPPFETTLKDLMDIEMEIDEICEECTKLSYFDTNVLKPQTTDTEMTAYINVFCTDDLTMAAEELSNVLINDFKIHVKPVYRSAINTSYKAFTALESHFIKQIDMLKVQLYEKYHHNKDPFSYELIKVPQDLVRIKLLSNDFQVMKRLQKTVIELLNGEILDKNVLVDIHKLFGHCGLIHLRTLERHRNVYILEEYNAKIVRIYGAYENCLEVKKAIIRFLKYTENEEADTIILNSNKKNRILLKAVIKNYGVKLQCFIELCSLQSAVLDIRSNRLLLNGSRGSIKKAKEAIKELSGSLDSTKDSLLGGGERCPVCGRPAFNPTFRLQHCKHLYCRECIVDLVTQAIFPIQCCAEKCSKDVVLDDIVKILDNDDKKIKQLLSEALNDFIKRNQTEIVLCPTPDCQMFLKKKDVSRRMTCPLCQNEICASCNVVYHYGYTCDAFKDTRGNLDDSLKDSKQKSDNCKKCPRCKYSIKRTADCDSITCAMCKAHFCWLCLREFPRATDVFNHIPSCDKMVIVIS